ncbi:MAG: nuclear transport factor 2 family protein [Betaproteobacteria bacterium]|nr:nuclear transport factor 2 family protein [Betaproteobacteria bacterium]
MMRPPYNKADLSAREIVTSFYAAIARGDVEAIFAVLHPNLDWTEAEGIPNASGTWRSRKEVVDKLLIRSEEDWVEFSATPLALSSDDRVVALGVYAGTAKSTGRSMQAEFAHLWSVRDGRLASFKMYADKLLIDRAMR